MTGAHLEYLGHCWTVGDSGRVLHRAYVLWLGVPPTDVTPALRQLEAEAWPCPECGRPWPLGRHRGAIESVEPHPSVRKVSDTCAHCQAIVHWDASDAAERGALRWIDMYERDPRHDGERFALHPRAPRGEAEA